MFKLDGGLVREKQSPIKYSVIGITFIIKIDLTMGVRRKKKCKDWGKVSKTEGGGSEQSEPNQLGQDNFAILSRYVLSEAT